MRSDFGADNSLSSDTLYTLILQDNELAFDSDTLYKRFRTKPRYGMDFHYAEGTISFE